MKGADMHEVELKPCPFCSKKIDTKKDMQKKNNVVYRLSEEELEYFSPIVTNVIKEICVFSDKYNFDRDSMLAYLSVTLRAMSELGTIEDYEV